MLQIFLTVCHEKIFLPLKITIYSDCKIKISSEYRYLGYLWSYTHLTQDVRIFETPVHRYPQMARHEIFPRFVRSTLWLKKCGAGIFGLSKRFPNIYMKAYHHSSSYCIRFLWAGNEKKKFFPHLLKSWVKWRNIFSWQIVSLDDWCFMTTTYI